MTFWQYLRQQRDRNDWVGDLARDALGDKDFPRGSPRHARLQYYLMSHDACREARMALVQAYREWRQAQVGTAGTRLAPCQPALERPGENQKILSKNATRQMPRRM